jgi:hypothetical protein
MRGLSLDLILVESNLLCTVSRLRNDAVSIETDRDVVALDSSKSKLMEWELERQAEALEENRPTQSNSALIIINTSITVPALARTVRSWVRSHSKHGCISAFILCLCRYRPCDGLIPLPRSPTDCLRIKKLKWNKAFRGCPMLHREQQGKERIINTDCYYNFNFRLIIITIIIIIIRVLLILIRPEKYLLLN